VHLSSHDHHLAFSCYSEPIQNERIFQLDQILKNRHTPASMHILCEHLECSQATIKRLIRDMRERFGAPIVNIRGSGDQYDLTQEFLLPPLLFNTGELIALLSIKQLIATLHPDFLYKTLSPVQQRIDRLLGKTAKGVNREIGRIRLLGIHNRHFIERCFDTVVSVEFTGELEVTDIAKFRGALFNWIGPAKTFGCGLLMVRRA